MISRRPQHFPLTFPLLSLFSLFSHGEHSTLLSPFPLLTLFSLSSHHLSPFQFLFSLSSRYLSPSNSAKTKDGGSGAAKSKDGGLGARTSRSEARTNRSGARTSRSALLSPARTNGQIRLRFWTTKQRIERGIATGGG
nr:hypothetical protein Itr_chr03CG08610 [Ipomoea trifida]